MKNWFNSDSKVIFNIIIALVLGVIFGNFIGSSMLDNEAIYANAVNYADEVYILQTGHYYDEGNANNCLNNMNDLGLDGIVVREYNNFYVYHGISASRSSFNEKTKILEDNNINYIIKTKKLYYFLTDLDPKSPLYEFYYTTINYYLSLIRNRNVVLIDDYVETVDVVNLDLYNSLNLLNQELNTKDSEIYKLIVYRNLVNLLLG